MMRAYDSVLLAELRKYTWNFAIKRASLAADFAAPLFGKKLSYTLPGDFLFLAPEETTFENPGRRDFNIEGNKIITSLSAPLEIRYVSNSITESSFDVLFAEALAAALAMATCEEITNSGSKKQDAKDTYREVIAMAKRRNAIENAPVKQPTCTWIAVRD